MTWAARLLAWFDDRRRDLPWRQSPDPYGIWLSEVMLQQTRVEVVIPYYWRFLARFPTVAALAAAPEAEVLALWSGLGYYRRARSLWRGAREVAARGSFPITARGWQELPGVGAYTAAAVASIAFGEKTLALDGNVTRVLSRWLARDVGPRGRGRRQEPGGLATAADELLDEARPGDSNQALMELGALVCRPRQPLCAACPLAPSCRARARGEIPRFPRPRPRRPPLAEELAVAVVARSGRHLLFRRPVQDAVLAGLWELPSAPWKGERRGAARALGHRYGGEWRLGQILAEMRHTITHRRQRIQIFAAQVEWPEVVEEGIEAAWLLESSADTEVGKDYPLTGLAAKILRRFPALAAPATQPTPRLGRAPRTSRGAAVRRRG